MLLEPNGNTTQNGITTKWNYIVIRTKCLMNKMSLQQNEIRTKHLNNKSLQNKMSQKQNVSRTKCLKNKMSLEQNVIRTKCH